MKSSPGASNVPRYLGSVFWMGMAEISYRVGNFLLQVLLVRALAPARYAVFAYAYSLFLVVVTLMSLGVSEAFIREGARRPERLGSVLSDFFALRLLSTSGTAAVILAVSIASGSDASVIFAVGLFLLFRSVTAFLATPFRARQVIWKEFAVRGSETAILLATTVASVVLGWRLATLAWALAAASAACLAGVIAGFRAFLPGFSWRLPERPIRSMLSAAPFGLPAVAGAWLLRIDIVCFQRLGRSPERTAYFAAAVNLILAAGLIPAIASAAVYPRLSRHARPGGSRGLVRATFLFLVVGAALAAGILAISDVVVRIAYGSRYAPAAAWLASLSPFLLFLSPGIFAATVLAARGETGRLCAVTLIPLAAKIVLDLVVLPGRPASVAPVSIALEGVAAISAILFVNLSDGRSVRA